MTERWSPVNVTLDGRVRKVEVRAFTIPESVWFAREWTTLNRTFNRSKVELRPWLRRLDVLDPPTDEPKVTFTEPPAPKTPEWALFLDQVAARATWKAQREADAISIRELEETEVERLRRVELEKRDDAFASEFLQKTVERFVRLQPGELPEASDLDVNEVVTGAQLIAHYAGRPTALFTFIAVVHQENTLSPELKKKSHLSFASMTSSGAPIPPASGDAPAPIAAGVSSSGSANSAAVMDPFSDVPSGEAAPSA